MKVIIVGGGIGGLAAAIGLRRAGHQVKVFERSSFLREVGAAIHVCPNASRVLLRWGLDARQARLVTMHRSVVARADTLQPLVETDCSSVTAQYGAPLFLAHRVDLHSELKRLATTADGAGSPVEVVLRATVVDYDADGGSVTLADSSVHRADLVVGADGVHTTAIKHILGYARPAVSTGSAAFRFLISTEDLVQDPETATLLKDSDGLFRIFTAEDVRRLVWYPCADNTVQNFVGIHADHDNDGREEDWDLSVDVNDVLTEYHDVHPALLATMKKATSVKRWPLLYRDPIPTWYRGRLVVIGDAAHPMLPHQGQGGAQAIEDAGALSVIFADLADHPSPDAIRDRLDLFQKVRLNRASAMQIFSNAGQDEAWKIRQRARAFIPDGAAVPSSPKEFMAHNFSYDVLEDSKAQLRAYLEREASFD